MRRELPVLLAARLLEVQRIVVRPDGEHAMSVAHQFGDVERERCVPAFVLADLDVVEPDSRVKIHGAESKHDALAIRRNRNIQFATIPHGRVEAVVVDAAAPGLG